MAEFRLSNFTSGTALTAAELNTGLTFTNYTPTWTQSATITKTVDWARYTKFGKLVIGTLKITATSAGTANNKILVGLPVEASTNNFVIGTMVIYETTGTATYSFAPKLAFYESSTTMGFTPVGATWIPSAASQTDVRAGQNFNDQNNSAVTGPTIASGDIIYVQFQYEAA